jgi:hypothetical protein
MNDELLPLPAALDKQCRRYMDDAPGMRADCEYQIRHDPNGCFDCPKRLATKVRNYASAAVEAALAAHLDKLGGK